VAFEFIDGNGVAGDSVAAVDNVVLEAVFIPEPSIPVTLLGVLGAAALRRRRRPGPVPHGLFFHGPP
jgi:MYXO-CTERM domain-containing protein